ncbi:hypothetical protein [Pontibacter pudoricolor]|nr:hypothetical protein [Pontibacter pudoricolor]
MHDHKLSFSASHTSAIGRDQGVYSGLGLTIVLKTEDLSGED